MEDNSEWAGFCVPLAVRECGIKGLGIVAVEAIPQGTLVFNVSRTLLLLLTILLLTTAADSRRGRRDQLYRSSAPCKAGGARA